MPARKTQKTRPRAARKPHSGATNLAFLPVRVKPSPDAGMTAAAEIPVAVKTSPHSDKEPVVRTAEIPVALKRGGRSGAQLALRRGNGASTKVTAIPLALGARHPLHRRTGKKAASRTKQQVEKAERRRDPGKIWNEAVNAITELEMYAVDVVFDVVKAVLWVFAGKPATAPQRAKVLAIDTLRTVEESALAA